MAIVEECSKNWASSEGEAAAESTWSFYDARILFTDGKVCSAYIILINILITVLKISCI